MARYNERLHCILGVLPTCYKHKAATYLYPRVARGAIAEEKQELEALVESLDKTCTRYKMEGDQCLEDQTDDKQRQWNPERDKGKRAEAGHCNLLQVPSRSCFK